MPGPSVHPVLNASTLKPYCLAPLDHRIDRRCPPMDRQFIWRLCLRCYISAIHLVQCVIFASLEPRNVYKDMLNNMVSHIDHVVMNHQNHTRTNVIWGHVRYNLPVLVIYDNPSKASINFQKIDKVEPLTLAWMLTIIQLPLDVFFPLLDLL
jgi:hypothetical protein